jgi:DNA polymerase V
MEPCLAVIDLKSFYASCECSVRHLDIFTTPLVCCDPYRSSSSIVMSATPYLKKKYGIPNVCRRRDLPIVPGMIYAVPRMSFYLKMSAKVVSIFLDYVAEEDLHVYSVDESFLNLGPYLNLYHCTAEELVARIQKTIWEKLGLIATAGIGPNMFLAKIALDNEGKKKAALHRPLGLRGRADEALVHQPHYRNLGHRGWDFRPLSPHRHP